MTRHLRSYASATILVCMVLTITMVGSSVSKGQTSWENSRLLSEAIPPYVGMTDGEDADDPGYSLYKSGYNMVLNEQWQEARSFFRKLAAAHPESEFCDDALYWTGYCRSQTDELGEAIRAYDQLIRDFPTSQYYDDAVADLTAAQTRLEIEQLSRELEGKNEAVEAERVRYAQDVQRQLSRLTWSRHMFPGMEYAETDPETQLRVDALNALNPDANDLNAFGTLKEVALDQSNPLILREQAVHIISGANNELALPVYLTLVKSDTSESIRMLSLDYLAQVPGDKSVEALIEVFQQIPSFQGELSAHVFYTIASVGNDAAVDFLTTVAKDHSDLNLRREAVFYLGSIGSERSRSALQSILRGK